MAGSPAVILDLEVPLKRETLHGGWWNRKPESLMTLCSPGLALGFLLHETEINFYLVLNGCYFGSQLLAASSNS